MTFDTILEEFGDSLLQRVKFDLEQDFFEKSRAKISELLKKGGAFQIGLQLSRYSYNTELQGVGYCLQGDKAGLNILLDGWFARRLRVFFGEQSLYENAKKCKNFNDFSEAYSTADPSDFLLKIWALCGEYCLGLSGKKNWHEFFSLLEMGLFRGDFDEDYFYKENEAYRMQMALLRFIAADKEKRKNLLSTLSAHKAFSFVEPSWQDDKKFSSGLEGLCEWHLKQCERSIQTKGEYTYHIPPYDIFPVWIFALDKCRSLETGKSSLLGHNKFFDFGERLLSGEVTEERNSFLVDVEKAYKTRYESPVDLIIFWRQFIGDSRQSKLSKNIIKWGQI